jgi:hypothetical protein
MKHICILSRSAFNKFIANDPPMNNSARITEVATALEQLKADLAKNSSPLVSDERMVIRCAEAIARAKGKVQEAIDWAFWRDGVQVLGVCGRVLLKDRVTEILDGLACELEGEAL